MPMYPGTLVNEIDMGCNLEALLIYDHDLFANMVAPDGVDLRPCIIQTPVG